MKPPLYHRNVKTIKGISSMQLVVSADLFTSDSFVSFDLLGHKIHSSLRERTVFIVWKKEADCHVKSLQEFVSLVETSILMRERRA